MTRALSERIVDYVLPWRDVDWPVDWPRVFGRRAPLVLEIGFGNGAFLEDLARRHPEHDHVGIELSWTAATHLFRRLDRVGATNVRAVLGEAHTAVAELFEEAALAAVFVNHPCPWPKARHHGRRLIEPDFLRLLANRMAPEAPLTIVTDHDDYAAWIVEALEGQDVLRSIHATTEVTAISGREPTKYESKALAQGGGIHYFEWRKVGTTPDAGPFPTSAPLATMPNLTLRGPVAFDDLLAELETITRRETHDGLDVVVKLGQAFREAHGRSWLVEAMVKEGRLQQDFALIVAPEAKGTILVKLSGLGARPHPTFGVKRAVWELGRWLREHHPGLELAHENLGDAVTGA